jgi:hypothetical protein
MRSLPCSSVEVTNELLGASLKTLGSFPCEPAICLCILGDHLHIHEYKRRDSVQYAEFRMIKLFLDGLKFSGREIAL